MPTSSTPVPAINQIDFEFVLFASAIIDYDYIMALLARFSNEAPDKLKMNREQLTELLEPLGLNWKARRVAELALMEDLGATKATKGSVLAL